MNPRFNVTLPTTLRNDIIEFALDSRYKNYFTLNGNSGLRRFCITDKFPDLKITQDLQQFSKLAYATIGVEDFEKEHMFGNFIGVNHHGGNVHQHKDPRNEKGFIHTRLNFLVQKPDAGGNPVIDGIEYTMEEGNAWLNLASEWLHSSTVVEGNTPRIVLSMGAYIHPAIIENLQKIMEK